VDRRASFLLSSESKDARAPSHPLAFVALAFQLLLSACSRRRPQSKNLFFFVSPKQNRIMTRSGKKKRGGCHQKAMKIKI